MNRLDDIFIANVNSEGSFSADLPDGEYSVESIYSDAFNYVYDVKVNTDYDRFSISEGIISVNGNEVEESRFKYSDRISKSPNRQ